MRVMTDKHRVLLVVEGSKRPLTTAAIAVALELPFARIHNAVSGLVGDHALTHGAKQPDGSHAWIMDEIGLAELDRLDTAYSGQQPARPRVEPDGWETL
jgi:hypothetical protein